MCKVVTCLILCSITAAICGNPQAIIGGNYAQPGEFPYNVYWKVNGNYQCGGALISTRHVLTAAHCIYKYYNNQFVSVTVTVGTINLNQGGNEYKVKHMKMHPKYVDGEHNIHNDIGVLTLEKDVQLSKFVSPVKLPNKNHNTGEYTTLSGFGVTDFNVQYPKITPYLRKVRTPIMDYSHCAAYHKRHITQGQICTFIKNGIGTCQGDSGSPVVSDDGQLVGIVSWGEPCAKGYPDVHSNVYYYLNFILDAIK